MRRVACLDWGRTTPLCTFLAAAITRARGQKLGTSGCPRIVGKPCSRWRPGAVRDRRGVGRKGQVCYKCLGVKGRRRRCRRRRRRSSPFRAACLGSGTTILPTSSVVGGTTRPSSTTCCRSCAPSFASTLRARHRRTTSARPCVDALRSWAYRLMSPLATALRTSDGGNSKRARRRRPNDVRAPKGRDFFSAAIVGSSL